MKTLKELRLEFEGRLWCGPTLVAMAADVSYGSAVAMIRAVDPEHSMNRAEPMRTTVWGHLVAALRGAGMFVGEDLLPLRRPTAGWPTLSTLARSVEPGLYMVRVTNHFLLMQVTPDGATILDNHGGARCVRSKAARSRRRVTHCALVQRISGSNP